MESTWKGLVVIALILSVIGAATGGIAFSTPPEDPVARGYNTSVYREQGGNKMVVASGGEVEVQSGGTLDVQAGSTFSAGVGTEYVGLASVITATVPYAPATGTVATVADGEIWFVHNVFIDTTTNFDCTGNDCTLTIGDGNDPNGFIDAADANIQTTFTEATGFAAGWFGIENGSQGAYTLDDGGPFVYAPSGAAETIDYAIGGTDPAAGSATVYVIYTRIQ